jgi:hypothetical protein
VIDVETLGAGAADEMAAFFSAAYTPASIFADPDFLTSYFDPAGRPDAGMRVVRDGSGRVVAHFGGLPTRWWRDGAVVPALWMVNAVTLPVARGRGFNGAIVSSFARGTANAGVVSFPAAALPFYRRMGFECFGGRRFGRLSRALRPDFLALADHVGAPRERLRDRLPVRPYGNGSGRRDVVRLDAGDADAFDLAPPAGVRLTTYRDFAHVKRRFVAHPFFSYAAVGVRRGGRIVAVGVARVDTLRPMGRSALRIVDLFGTFSGVAAIVDWMLDYATNVGCAYVDFPRFGAAYDAVLSEMGFTLLAEDDFCLLPQVSAPVEARPNLEYVALRLDASGTDGHPTADAVYLTAADADRDRANRRAGA